MVESREGQTRELLAAANAPLKFPKRSPEMASLIMAAEPLVVPVAATVVLQPIDTGPSACGQQHELTCDAWEALERSQCLKNALQTAEP